MTKREIVQKLKLAKMAVIGDSLPAEMLRCSIKNAEASIKAGDMGIFTECMLDVVQRQTTYFLERNLSDRRR